MAYFYTKQEGELWTEVTFPELVNLIHNHEVTAVCKADIVNYNGAGPEPMRGVVFDMLLKQKGYNPVRFIP